MTATTDERKSMSLRTPPKRTPFIYVVYWPASSTLKVGRANHMGRIRKHAKTGAKVMLLLRDRPFIDEIRALESLKGGYHPRAYACIHEAHEAALLGDGSSGYTECYSVPVDDVAAAVRRIMAAIVHG